MLKIQNHEDILGVALSLCVGLDSCSRYVHTTLPLQDLTLQIQRLTDTCDSCKFLIGGFELSLVNPDGSTNVDGENYKQIEGYLLQGCMTLFPKNEEYRNFCTSGVTTFLPAIISGLIKDYPPEKLCQLLGACTP